MKTRLLPIVAGILIAFSACKYDSPLTEKPTRDIDTALLGHWFSLADGSPLNVYRLSNNEFLVHYMDNPYVCTHSDLAGVNFVSCQYKGNDSSYYGKFSYMTYKIDKGGDLTLTNLDDDALSLGSLQPKERREKIEQAIKNGKGLDSKPEDVLRFKKEIEKKERDKD